MLNQLKFFENKEFKKVALLKITSQRIEEFKNILFVENIKKGGNLYKAVRLKHGDFEFYLYEKQPSDGHIELFLLDVKIDIRVKTIRKIFRLPESVVTIL